MPRLRELSALGSVVGFLAAAIAIGPTNAGAHCDTTEGPVVQDARRALESGDVAAVLKWISAADEPAIRSAFQATLGVRKLGDQAKALADQYFFETLVRVHRAGEGAPYEGLKSPDSIPEAVAAADQALVSGSVDELVQQMEHVVTQQVLDRFHEARQRRAHAEDSPEAGRAYVAAYVEYVHFVEALDGLVGRGPHAHGGGEQPEGHRH